jgi:endonuclease/exonuclease/phosphatase family metal-dependent hydrolase
MAQPWLTLLSWNVHGLPFHGAPARLRRIAAWIGERRPDLVLLQEVWSPAYERLLADSLAREYDASYTARRFSRRPHGGLLTLIRRDAGWRTARVSFETYGSAAPWFRLNEGDGLSGKGILAVELRRDAETLLAVNTHLQAQYGERGYANVRRRQLEQLGAFVRRAGEAVPLLLAGDLNTLPEENLYDSHIASLGEDLTAEERCLRGGATCFDRAGGRSEWIDYAILRGAPAAVSLTRIESHAPDDPYSDHDGLLLRIER